MPTTSEEVCGSSASGSCIGKQCGAIALRVGGQFEMPQLIGVDLAQAEPGSVGDEPAVSGGTAHVDRLADDVLGQVRGLDVLPGHRDAAVGVHCVVEQALLEL